MKPVIGITSDINENFFRIRHEYVSSIAEFGGMPLILAPQNTATFGKEGIEEIADLIDGLLLTGGGDIPPEYYGEDMSVPQVLGHFAQKQRIDFEIDLLREVVRRRKPVLAVCLGMQLVNVAFGGSLYQDISLQVADAIDHRREHEIKVIQPSAPGTVPILRSVSPVNWDSPLTINSFHHQAVKKLGDGLDVFAMSEDGIIEGFYKKGYPFLFCVQWHPERSLKLQTAGAAAVSGSPKLTDNTHTTTSEKYDKLSIWLFETFIKTSAAVTGKSQIKEQK